MSGTSASPIRLRALPGEEGLPVLTVPQNTSANQQVLEIAASYFTVGPGLVLERATGNSSANIWGCGPSSGCSGGSNPDYVTIIGNEIRRGCDQGILTEEESQHWRISRNFIHDHGAQNAGCPTRLHQSHDIYLQGDYQLVDNNLLTNTPDGMSIQVYDYCQHCRVVSNSFDNAYHASIALGGGGCSSRTGLCGASDIDIVNNIGTRSGPAAYAVYCDSQPPTNYRIRDNIWYIHQALSNCTLGADNLEVDPLYVAIGSDYHLRSASPGVDSGDSAWLYSPDLGAGLRPQGLGIDKGAYER